LRQDQTHITIRKKPKNQLEKRRKENEQSPIPIDKKKKKGTTTQSNSKITAGERQVVEWVGLGDNPKETTMELDNDSPIGGRRTDRIAQKNSSTIKIFLHFSSSWCSRCSW